MFNHDLIKIRYIHYGYLPNYPYHMISTEEMCNAFLSESGTSFFEDTYSISENTSAEVKSAYHNLIDSITFHLHKLMYGNEIPPDWVYSYMLGTVVNSNSSNYNIHDLLVLLGIDNIDDDFNLYAEQACLEVSKSWIKKLRLSKDYTITDEDITKYRLPAAFLHKTISLRPPTIFGEPHVVKSLRLSQTNIVQ